MLPVLQSDGQGTARPVLLPHALRTEGGESLMDNVKERVQRVVVEGGTISPSIATRNPARSTLCRRVESRSSGFD